MLQMEGAAVGRTISAHAVHKCLDGASATIAGQVAGLLAAKRFSERACCLLLLCCTAMLQALRKQMNAAVLRHWCGLRAGGRW